MRLVDVVGSFAPVLSVVAITLVASRRRMIRRLQRAGASSEAAAQPLVGRGLTAFWRRRLLGAGVLKTAGGGAVWLDEPAWQRYQRVRRRRGLVIGITLAAAVLAAAALAKLR